MIEPRPRARRHAPAEERRDQILVAALSCFAEKGYRAATMDDLARAAGLSKGSLYWHFESKDAVFLALFDHVFDELLAAWDSLIDEGRSAVGVVRGMFEVQSVEPYLAGPVLGVLAEFFAHPGARDKLGKAYAEIRTRLAGCLQRDVAEGRIRDIPVESAAAVLTAAGEGLMLQAMVDETFDVREHWPMAVDMIERGIAR